MGSGTYRVRLHVLTPLHVGCGQEFEPMSFVVDKINKRMIVFDPVGFVRGLPGKDRAEFLRICEQGTLGSILEIYRFLDRHAGTARGRAVAVCDGFLDNHRNVLRLDPKDRRLQNEMNRFAIGRTAFNPCDGSPYIPGSALKGALRTGYLNDLCRLDPLRGIKDSKDLESRLMGGTFSEDPFRLVRVSDFMPCDTSGACGTKILYAINRKKKVSKFQFKGPPQILEAVTPGVVFEGLITIQEKPKGSNIRHGVSRETFFRSVSSFYEREMVREQSEMSGVSIPHDVAGRMKKLFGEKVGVSVYPVRLGRHSGAESVTIEGHRKIKILAGRGREAGTGTRATTFWLAAERKDPGPGEPLLPFGWAAMEIIPLQGGFQWPVRRLDGESSFAGVPISKSESPHPQSPPPRKVQAETVVWEGAIVTWLPGNRTLKAIHEGKKAELVCQKDSSIVADSLRKKIFSGKESRARVTVEPLGNSFKISKVESLQEG